MHAVTAPAVGLYVQSFDYVGSLAVTAASDRGHIRLYVTRSQAAAFCDHADELVAAGRPNCQWCGNPIDPDGHPCPRMN